MRTDIAFQSNGATLRGWLYRPEAADLGRAPIIVMARGFSAVKEHFLDKFAQVFRAAGLAVLVYDHRNTGASDGDLGLQLFRWDAGEPDGIDAYLAARSAQRAFGTHPGSRQ